MKSKFGNSVTEEARALFNEALDFKITMHKDKMSFKLDVCGHKYITDAPLDLMENEKGQTTIWLNLFKEFEKDLDAGVEERKERIIRPEGFNGIIQS